MLRRGSGCPLFCSSSCPGCVGLKYRRDLRFAICSGPSIIAPGSQTDSVDLDSSVVVILLKPPCCAAA